MNKMRWKLQDGQCSRIVPESECKFKEWSHNRPLKKKEMGVIELTLWVNIWNLEGCWVYIVGGVHVLMQTIKQKAYLSPMDRVFFLLYKMQ